MVRWFGFLMVGPELFLVTLKQTILGIITKFTVLIISHEFTVQVVSI